MTDKEYFAALKGGAAKGNVVAAWELAAQFIKMIDRGETPHPPRRGKTIGSIRPVLTTWKSRRRGVE